MTIGLVDYQTFLEPFGLLNNSIEKQLKHCGYMTLACCRKRSWVIQMRCSTFGRELVTVHAPPSYDPNDPIPVVIALHGWGGDEAWMERYWGIQPLADAWDFSTPIPVGPSPQSDVGRLPPF